VSFIFYYHQISLKAQRSNVLPLLMYSHTFDKPVCELQELSDFLQIWQKVISFTLERLRFAAKFLCQNKSCHTFGLHAVNSFE
jgi:hypothetical protein